MGLTILFTYLNIILLQCFQFSVFSNNKFNPNTPITRDGVYSKIKKKNIVVQRDIIMSQALSQKKKKKRQKVLLLRVLFIFFFIFLNKMGFEVYG